MKFVKRLEDIVYWFRSDFALEETDPVFRLQEALKLFPDEPPVEILELSELKFRGWYNNFNVKAPEDKEAQRMLRWFRSDNVELFIQRGRRALISIESINKKTYCHNLETTYQELVSVIYWLDVLHLCSLRNYPAFRGIFEKGD